MSWWMHSLQLLETRRVSQNASHTRLLMLRLHPSDWPELNEQLCPGSDHDPSSDVSDMIASDLNDEFIGNEAASGSLPFHGYCLHNGLTVHVSPSVINCSPRIFLYNTCSGKFPQKDTCSWSTFLNSRVSQDPHKKKFRTIFPSPLYCGHRNSTYDSMHVCVTQVVHDIEKTPIPSLVVSFFCIRQRVNAESSIITSRGCWGGIKKWMA